MALQAAFIYVASVRGLGASWSPTTQVEMTKGMAVAGPQSGDRAEPGPTWVPTSFRTRVAC